jgi:hypothetical protein
VKWLPIKPAPPAMNSAGQKSRFDEERPEILHVVIRLVIVHFILWAQAQPECREFQKFLSAPGRDIEHADAVRPDDAAAMLKSGKRIPKMFQHGDAQNDIETRCRRLFQHARKGSFNCRHFGRVLEICRQPRINEYGMIDHCEHASNELGMITTSEISDSFTGHRTRVPLDLTRREPHAKPVHKGRLIILTVCSLASAFEPDRPIFAGHLRLRHEAPV